MNSSELKVSEARAQNVKIDSDTLEIDLVDGRAIRPYSMVPTSMVWKC